MAANYAAVTSAANAAAGTGSAEYRYFSDFGATGHADDQFYPAGAFFGRSDVFVRDLVHKGGVAHVDVPAVPEDVDHPLLARGVREHTHLQRAVVVDDESLPLLGDEALPELIVVVVRVRDDLECSVITNTVRVYGTGPVG